jgi:hypothetical protein
MGNVGALAAVSAALLLGSGCDQTFISVSSDGRLEISVSTDGGGVDADGFSVTVDGRAAGTVHSGEPIRLTGLTEGVHRVGLGDVATNCAVIGSNPQSVVVGADGVATAGFAVHCTAA